MNKSLIAVVRNIKVPCSFDEVSNIDAKALEYSKKYFAFSKVGKDAYFGEPFIYKRSVDARDNNALKIVYSVGLRINPEITKKAFDSLNRFAKVEIVTTQTPVFQCKKKVNRPVVAGFGPSGMFCALALARAGLCPIVAERGDDVDIRAQKVEYYWKSGVLDENSNVQFGEGGAGTFSDGKLVTRISDPLCSFVLEEFVKNGAPTEILYEAKPHIGTDNLRKIVKNIRREIIELGGEIMFGCALSKIDFKSNGQVKSVYFSNGQELFCDALFLCIGHSARDTFKMLTKTGVAAESKAFSVGVRIEHLQMDIDDALYGKNAGAPILSHAQYNLSHRFDKRAAYSFCMCPGGIVTASASSRGEIVTNGMSYYKRDGINANSALAVSVDPFDFGNNVDGAIAFQKNIEIAAFKAAGCDNSAPIQTLGDFLEDKCTTLPSKVLPTYTGTTKLCKATDVLPDFVVSSLKAAIPYFEKEIRGFSDSAALLTFPETRTSSPVRLPRNELMQSTSNANVFPVGEGAGYAGGITSAAVDGLRAALKFMQD